jgi:outer membrane protein
MRNLALLSALSIFVVPMAFASDCKPVPKPVPKCTPPKPAPKCTPPKKAPPPKCYCETECNPTDWSAQVRGAAFLPLTDQIRDIYGHALPAVELEVSWSFLKDAWLSCDQLTLWANGTWAFKTGETEGFEYYTRLNLIPISVGLEYQIYLGAGFDFYFGAGPTYSFLRVQNYDGFNRYHHKKGQFGVTTRTGFRYTFCTNFFIDVFGDYYYTKFGEMHDSVQNLNGRFSGFFVGGGFGGKW